MRQGADLNCSATVQDDLPSAGSARGNDTVVQGGAKRLFSLAEAGSSGQ